MGRLFGIIAMLMGVWAGAEIYTKGFDAAFGGALAGFDDPVVPLAELHSGGGRGAGPPGRARAQQSDSEDWTDDSDTLVVEDEDPFAPKRTPITRLGAHIQGEINDSFEDRYGNR